MRFWLALMAVSELDQLVELAQHAEACGFHGVTYADHLIMPARITTPYPYSESGEIFWPIDSPCAVSGRLSSAPPGVPAAVTIVAAESPLIVGRPCAPAIAIAT